MQIQTGRLTRRHIASTSMPRKIITGDWDGEPIWRWETSAERLVRELENPPALMTYWKGHVISPTKPNLSRV